MKTLLKIILALRGCRHRWEKAGTLFQNIDPRYRVGDEKTYKNGVILRCKRCGDMQARKLI